MIPGWSRNWFRTSTTTCDAARPTSRIASDENRNATEPPISNPTRTLGSSTRIPSNGNPARRSASSKDPNSDVAAMTAVAIARPFVIALVELPTASRLPSTCAGRPSNSPDISAIPCALSDTGPKVSIDTMTPTVVSIPIPVSEMKYRASRALSPSTKAPEMTPAMIRIDQTVDPRPIAKPERIVVAGPGWVDLAISWTGLNFVSVKYCVRIWITPARVGRNSTAQGGPRTSMETGLVTKAAAAEIAADRKKPRLIARIPCSSSLRGVTARMPMIEVITPTARTNSGNITPAMAPTSVPANAAAPRISDATSVTSYDSNRSAAIPAQSPTLSPTLSAIVAALRGSSSGIPTSTLPTRSAPTSAALVKMPPPTRMNIASSPPPNPPEPEPPQDGRRILLVDEQDHGGAQEPEPDREHPGHPAGAERDPQG